MKNSELERPFSSEDEFDDLFDRYLKPLKSKNARKIFKIIIEYGRDGPLTTLDVQDKLNIFEIKLDKKEINGWLSNLLVAGLISKEIQRGKPTTVKYENRYTFDLWRLTDIGVKFAQKLPMLLRDESAFLVNNPIIILEEMAQKEKVTRELILRRLKELFIIIKALDILYKADMGLTQTEFFERLKLSQMDVEKVISTYSEKHQPLFIKRLLKRGIRNSFLKIFGISGNVEFSLSEEGRKLAENLSFEARVE